MEKQPIDELFNRKLYDAEITPSGSAWTALQEKSGNKRVIPLWTYASIAASLLLIGSFGWWVISKSDQRTPEITVAQTVRSSDGRLSHPEQLQPNNEDKKPAIKQPGVHQTQPERLAIMPEKVKKDRLKLANKAGIEQLSTIQIKSEAVVHQSIIAPISQRGNEESNRLSKQSEPIIEPTPIVIMTKDQPRAAALITPERTLIVRIEVPVKTEVAPIEPTFPTENNMPKSGFGNLLSKVIRLKDGETLASSTKKSAKTSRRGFGKFYEEVKESIQNNSTDQ